MFTDRSEAERTLLSEILQRYLKEVTPRKRGRKQEASRIRPSEYSVCRQSLAALRASDIASYRDDRLREVCRTTVNEELNLLAHVIDTS